MFGLVEWRGAGERCGAREKCLGGVRFLAVGIRRGDGLRAVWSLRTAARTLERYGVTQAVFPRGFSAYERFAARGIVPVDVRPLREAAAAAIARRVMAQQEIAPRRATVALCESRAPMPRRRRRWRRTRAICSSARRRAAGSCRRGCAAASVSRLPSCACRRARTSCSASTMRQRFLRRGALSCRSALRRCA